MFERVKGRSGGTDGQLAVNTRVRVYPGTDAESRGVVVEDFGEIAAQPVEIGGQRFADLARRWAVLLDTGNLVFANTDQLVPE
ncbi:hypothetical protein [Mycobacterium sp.]|uniref:hypothetical protein n=1 Tax=Mycobacterium sp. TaxID=1785 RepID=UPI003C73A098